MVELVETNPGTDLDKLDQRMGGGTINGEEDTDLDWTQPAEPLAELVVTNSGTDLDKLDQRMEEARSTAKKILISTGLNQRNRWLSLSKPTPELISTSSINE